MNFTYNLSLLEDIACGDVNGSGTRPNVADLVYYVDSIFKGGPPPQEMWAADVDGSGQLNIADLVFLVDYIFRGGPAPEC